uniref:hypothetical protein n=1 Tax=Fulvivirga sp. TaxID=1931237 RepID=UPI004049FA0C
MFRKIIFGSLLLLFVNHYTYSQEDVTLKGYFLEDSIKIGIGTPYVLTAKYPISVDFIFPDSLYDFSPYELDEKLYYPTKSDSEYSYDSAVYYLTSFEIDSIQFYQMPAFILKGKDSVILTTQKDSIFLQQLVSEIPDSVAVEAMPLIENTTYKKVNFQFNYPYLIIGLVLLFIILIIVFVFFGKPIRKWFLLKKMSKAHMAYLDQLDKTIASDKNYEHLITLWKNYHAKLEGEPYTSYTTKELLKLAPVKSIETVLRNIDKAIYGKPITLPISELYQLKNFSQERFEEKIKEVENG